MIWKYLSYVVLASKKIHFGSTKDFQEIIKSVIACMQ